MWQKKKKCTVFYHNIFGLLTSFTIKMLAFSFIVPFMWEAQMQSTSNIMLFPYLTVGESILWVSSLRLHLVIILWSSVDPQCWAVFFFSINHTLPTHTNATTYCFLRNCPIFDTLPDLNYDTISKIHIIYTWLCSFI